MFIDFIRMPRLLLLLLLFEEKWAYKLLYTDQQQRSSLQGHV